MEGESLNTYKCIIRKSLKETITSLFSNHVLSESFIDDLAEKMMLPPLNSTLRINSLLKAPEEGLFDARELLKASGCEFTVKPASDLPSILFIPAKGPFYVYPESREAIISVECSQSVLRGSHVYATGILGLMEDYSGNTKVSLWADLENKCLRGSKKVFLGKKTFIGNGILLMDHHSIFKNEAQGLAIEITETQWKMPSFNLFPKNMFFPQNFPSILVIEELNIQAGMKVLDMCAAPGGKASHAAIKLGDSGLLIALDKNKKKVSKLQNTLESLGSLNSSIKSFVFNSSKLSLEEKGQGEALKGLFVVPPEAFTGNINQRISDESFDRIILDPPCSGFGQRPVIVHEGIKDSAFDGFDDYQRRMMRVAYKLLKKGGLLAYSTCTLTFSENEGVVKYALENLPGLVLESPKFKQYGQDGLEFGDQVRRFWPNGPDDTIAFFYAVFRKQ